MKRRLTSSKVKSTSYKRKNKATRKYKKLNHAIKQKRNHRGSGLSSSKQRSGSPLEELNQIESEYKNKSVYQKLCIIKKLSQSSDNTLVIDNLIDKKLSENAIKPELSLLKIKELIQLKNSLTSMGAKVEDTAIEKNELVDSLNRELTSKTNVKVDNLLMNMITKKRQKIVEQLKEDEEKMRIQNLETQRKQEIRRQEKEKKIYEDEVKRQQKQREKEQYEERLRNEKFNEHIALAEEREREERQMEEMRRYNNPNTVHHYHHYGPSNNDYQTSYQYYMDAQRELEQIPESARQGNMKNFY
jgi:hypothetical protein